MLAQRDKIFKFSNLKPTLAKAMDNGDWQGTMDSIAKGSEYIIDTIKRSQLRGRGGAGFSTGIKWSFMPKPSLERPNYLVINADESEPGTCKDRDILRYEPYKLLEGILLASAAINAKKAFIYVRGEFFHEAKILEHALEELYRINFLGPNAQYPLDIIVHRGAGAYICGEETALLESLEGKRGMPRLKPPFPAQYGLYGCPTTINNVETLAVVPEIMRRGANWFAGIGRKNNTGTKLFCISGHVKKPCNVEEALGISMRDLIENYAGGVIGGWDNLQAVIPGGSSTPLLPKHICDHVDMDFDSLHEAGSALGTAGVIVINKSVDIIDVISRIARFYMHESCGQCAPCREGTGWMWRMLEVLKRGEGTAEDIKTLQQVTEQVEGHTICALGDAAAWPIQGLIKHFKPLIEARQKDVA